MLQFNMMNLIFVFMLCSSLLLCAANGNIHTALEALTNGADSSVKLMLTLSGSYILWLGLLKIAERAGLTAKLAALMRRPMKLLMPNIGEAAASVTMNLSANFLGLANAATPFGLEAMKQLSKQNGSHERASREICMFLALNASAVELLPTSVIAIRSACGSSDAYSIVLPTFISSVFAAFTAIFACKFFEEAER